MEDSRKPVLSIGMIFKNEIRCLERCLRSLTPLREAVPCELVMADTGSTDGSREIAAGYADILFDFPWTDDFSAARNAVLARCSGTWHLAIDADEWLEDCSGLIGFLSNPGKWEGLGGLNVTVRNYTNLDTREWYGDGLLLRLVRRTPEVRYSGAIHETPAGVAGAVDTLPGTILHHDGYADHTSERGQAKRRRNMSLLEKELARDPKNLRRMVQCFESADGGEKEKYLRMMVDGVEARLPGWKDWGAVIYRYAVYTACEQELPEAEAWAEQARKLFRGQPYVTMDISFFLIGARLKRNDFSGAARAGEDYLAGLKDYRRGRYDKQKMLAGPLWTGAPVWETPARVLTAQGYAMSGQYPQAKEMLAGVNPEAIDAEQVERYTKILLFLESRSESEPGNVLASFWDSLSSLPAERAEQIKKGVQSAAEAVFSPEYRAQEESEHLRHAWRLFLPLAGKCPLGDAAALLDSEERATQADMAKRTDARTPVLSIGMIFKNEIHCLERCLRSLAPLREAVPCELVMADTGSTDGSREIAARYADILFDFPWVDDFSAARNAVLARCSGAWHLAIDADEWLEDCSALAGFLSDPKQWENLGVVGVTQRNYTQENSTAWYNDATVSRLFRRTPGVLYIGAIHELPGNVQGKIVTLPEAVLHHDGYVDFSGPKGGIKAKRARNMALLKKELALNPKDLRCMLQCFESSEEEEREKYLRMMLGGVEARFPKWEKWGANIYSHAVQWASERGLPEMEEWAAQGRTLFPRIPCITMDVSYALLFSRWKKGDFAGAARAGEAYFSGLADYRAGRYPASDMFFSQVWTSSPAWETKIRVFTADSFARSGNGGRAEELLSGADPAMMDGNLIVVCVETLLFLESHGGIEPEKTLAALWERLSSLPVGDKRKKEIQNAGTMAFSPGYRAREDKEGLRHAWRLFLPLAGKSPLGDAAAVLDADSPEELTERLAAVGNWAETPASVLAYALERGAAFPTKPVRWEELNELAAHLGSVAPELLNAPAPGTLPGVCWANLTALTALKRNPWIDPEAGMAVVRHFVQTERQYLSLYYAETALTEQGLFLLPPAHRFGYHCILAFDALENGDRAAYVRLLREGLEEWPESKRAVEFLVNHIPQPKTAVPAELLALAEKVRAILAGYPADDPAVLALKKSPVYQRVAYLLEENGASEPAAGGIETR